MSTCLSRASKQVFGVYLGLTASGYDLARPSRSQCLCQLIQGIKASDWPRHVLAYFRKARTDSCAVNPYWPRAFLLSLASLYLPESPPYQYSDPGILERHIEGLDAVSPADKRADTIRWVLQLPDIYQNLWAQSVTDRLWTGYEGLINLGQAEKVAVDAAALVVRRTGIAPGRLPGIVVHPNPLQAPEVTAAVAIAESIYIIASEPDLASCIHEMLHHLLSPALALARGIIREFAYLLEPLREDMLRLGYAWDDKEQSWHRVFEEHVIRAAQIWITCGEDPESAERAAADQVRYGFRYVPAITRCFRLHWSGIDSAEDFVTHCLHACQKCRA